MEKMAYGVATVGGFDGCACVEGGAQVPGVCL